MFIQKNKIHHHLFNLVTYWLTLLSSNTDRKTFVNTNKEIQPLWVTGFFRSGSSITTQILSILGMDIGPDNQLITPKGKRKFFNPGGFFENFLFMDISQYIFKELDAWGHQPPGEENVRQFELEKVNYKDYVYFSIVTVHDDRVSNFNKMRILRKYHPLNLNYYLEKEFTEPFVVKNPHFSVISSFLMKYWPGSRFLVLFRNPDAAVNSAKRIVDTMDYELYTDYHSRLLNKQADVSYFSYDHLMASPEHSINKLAENFNLSKNNIAKALKVIDRKKNEFACEMQRELWPVELETVYNRMLERAINVE